MSLPFHVLNTQNNSKFLKLDIHIGIQVELYTIMLIGLLVSSR